MITNLLNEVNEKIETLNDLVQNKEYFEKLDERIEKANNYVQEQQQEIERLTKQNKALNEMYELTKKEYIRLNNIVNELEKLLKEEKTRTRYANDVERFTAYDFALKRLQELKGDGSNEKI